MVYRKKIGVYCYPNKEFDIMGCNHRETSCLIGE